MPNNPAVSWLDQVKIAFTYCSEDGEILYMNRVSAETFAADGGEKLLGKNALDCHPEQAKQKLQELLDHPVLNAYTIEKQGRKKLIYQVPVWDGDTFKGIVEISLPLPENMPHFVRK
jgi:hypothetical protein